MGVFVNSVVYQPSNNGIIMREIARIYDKDATKLKHDETSLIIQRELDNGRDVAVIYILCENAGKNQS